ncbi:hypothetical protein [Lyngbya aestuarii]|uniref:hypothetical protein n=1 Tax=Lyngbya aestuarii TaxID=118322 RepID=UPI00403E1CDD
MKCVRCGTDNKLKERTANFGSCKNCGHSFSFEPTSMGSVKFTDAFFAKTITDISAENTLFFTAKQLFYLLNKRLKIRIFKSNRIMCIVVNVIFFVLIFLANNSIANNNNLDLFLITIAFLNIVFVIGFFRNSNSPKVDNKQRIIDANSLYIIGAIILLEGVVLSVKLNLFSVFAISVILGILSIYLGIRQRRRQTEITETFLFDQNQFQQWLSRWALFNNSFVEMLPPPQEERNLAQISPDISAYSFDRLIVCDHAAIAQMLIANNFHFEHNCAVLSITGYPHNIFDTIMQMLRRNPNLKVYALHDASPSGVMLMHQLQTNPTWFRDSEVIIYDLGLLPRQVLNSRIFFVQGSDEMAQEARQLPPEVRRQLSVEELSWLDSGKFVELESFTPRKILQVITNGIAQTQSPEFGGNIDSSNVIESDGDGDNILFFVSESFG